MIAPLRRRHRLWTLTLAVVMPVLYVLALTARPQPPVADLPSALAAADAGGEVVREATDLFAVHAVTVRVRRGTGGWKVELEPQAPIVRPEILVYWSPSAPASEALPAEALPAEALAAEALPAEAFLLGSLAGTRARVFDLPTPAFGGDGWLVLYSLGHQEVIDTAALSTAAVGTVGEAVEDGS